MNCLNEPSQNKLKFTLCRYFLFLFALFVMSMGVAIVTLALLGTSPINSVPYVLSMFTGLTLGQWTIIFNLLLVVAELPFLTRAQMKTDKGIFFMQLPICLFFGLFIDLSMNLFSWLVPRYYLTQLLSMFIGSVVVAIGIALEVKANIGMASGEYFVRAFSRRFRLDFGYTKLGFDISCVLLAATLSLVFMSSINGIREGTLIAALITGPIIHFIFPWFRFLDDALGYNKFAVATGDDARNYPLIITISREYGSGGRELGELLAKKLGIKMYDREVVSLAAVQSGISEESILANTESIPSFWMKCIFAGSYGMGVEKSLSPDDVLYVAESRIIQQITERESCIIMGRLADFILKGRPNVIRVFCHTDIPDAVKRYVAEFGGTEAQAEEAIRELNHKRIAYYEYYTGQRWGDARNFDLSLHTGIVGIPHAAKMISVLYKAKV